MASQKLALILKNPQNDNEFLVVKQSHPRKFDHEEYDSFVDSDLWDLPSAQLNPLQGESGSQNVVEVADSHLEGINLKEFDFHSALNEIFEQMGFEAFDRGVLKFCKNVKEPAFGPDLPIQTVFVTGVSAAKDRDLRGYTSI